MIMKTCATFTSRLHKLRSRTGHAYRVTTTLQKRSARIEETEMHVRRVDNR